jgi:hypothetical protein
MGHCGEDEEGKTFYPPLFSLASANLHEEGTRRESQI